MSKFDEKMELYTSSMKDISRDAVDVELLTKVAKGLGPSIYNNDSSLVSGSDQAELDRVKANFLIKKHGLTDSPKLDEAIKAVAAEMGSGNRQKHRAIFYYLLVKKLGLAGNYK